MSAADRILFGLVALMVCAPAVALLGVYLGWWSI